MPTPQRSDDAAYVAVLGPPPLAGTPGDHPWAAAATAWADRMNCLQGAADHSVFTTADRTGVHMAYWPTTTCPRCGNPQPTAGTPWTVPPAGSGAVSWGWRHPCGARWAPDVTVLRWADLERQVQVGPAPDITSARVLDALTLWYLTSRERLVADDDDDLDDLDV